MILGDYMTKIIKMLSTIQPKCQRLNISIDLNNYTLIYKCGGKAYTDLPAF